MTSPVTGSLFDDELDAQPTPGRTNKLHASAFERRALDFYETPVDLLDALVVGLQRLGLPLPAVALDPCGGAGAIRRALAVHGVDVRLTDIAPQAYAGTPGYVSQDPLDATKLDHLCRAVSLSGSRAVITNTPYGKLAQPIARNLVSLVETGELDMAALLFSSLWSGAGERASLFDSITYTGRIDCLWRPEWIAGTGGGGTMPFSWFVWSRHSTARTVSIRREDADAARRRAGTTTPNPPQETPRTTTADSASEKGHDQ